MDTRWDISTFLDINSVPSYSRNIYTLFSVTMLLSTLRQRYEKQLRQVTTYKIDIMYKYISVTDHLVLFARVTNPLRTGNSLSQHWHGHIKNWRVSLCTFNNFLSLILFSLTSHSRQRVLHDAQNRQYLADGSTTKTYGRFKMRDAEKTYTTSISEKKKKKKKQKIIHAFWFAWLLNFQTIPVVYHIYTGNKPSMHWSIDMSPCFQLLKPGEVLYEKLFDFGDITISWGSCRSTAIVRWWSSISSSGKPSNSL